MGTYTTTETRTETYARHIAAKMAADLKRLQRLMACGKPSDQEIREYQLEAIALLRYGYLKEVIYGFKRNDNWVVGLKYEALNNTIQGAGDDPGGIFPADVGDAFFSSLLTYSGKWHGLPAGKRAEFEQSLPFQRVEVQEAPGVENGYWAEDRRYLSGSLGAQRSMIERGW